MTKKLKKRQKFQVPKTKITEFRSRINILRAKNEILESIKYDIVNELHMLENEITQLEGKKKNG